MLAVAALVLPIVVLAVAILSRVHVPGSTQAGVTSIASINHWAPIGNYVVFAAALVISVPVAVVVARRARLSLPVSAAWVRIAAVALATAWIINVTGLDLTSRVDDTFHEGELLGFVPAFGRPNPFINAFLIHGFVGDVAPSLLASAVAPGHGIAVTRLLYVALGMLTSIALVLIVREIAALGSVRNRDVLILAGLTVLMLGHGTIYALNPTRSAPFEPYRSLAPLAAVFVLIRFLRARREERPRAAALAAFAAGLAVVSAPLVTYESGVLVALAVTAFGVCLALRQRGDLLPWLSWASAGGIVGAAALVSWLGPAQIAALGEQLAYWARHGRDIWFAPFAAHAVIGDPMWMAGVGTQMLGTVALWKRRAPSTDGAVGMWIVVLVLLIVSLAAGRGALDRADGAHFAIASFAAAPLLVASTCLLLQTTADWRTLDMRRWTATRAAAIVGMTAFVLFVPRANPLVAGRLIAHYVHHASDRDSSLVSASYLEIATTLRERLRPDDCLFTLTSEGIWYYLTGTPSCSRFHQIAYARTHAAQDEVVRALTRRAPPWIVVKSPSWSMTMDGGIPVDVFAPRVSAYVRDAYEPDVVRDGIEIWRRRAGDVPSGRTESLAAPATR